MKNQLTVNHAKYGILLTTIILVSACGRADRVNQLLKSAADSLVVGSNSGNGSVRQAPQVSSQSPQTAQTAQPESEQSQGFFLGSRLGRFQAPVVSSQTQQPKSYRQPYPWSSTSSQVASVSTQVVYRMVSVFYVGSDLSTWKNMEHYYTENPSEAGGWFKEPYAEFRTFTRAAGTGCTAQLYKCAYFRSSNDARQFLSLDPNCLGQFRNGAAINPSVGFVCTSPKPGTARLWGWYRSASEGRIYTTNYSDQILTNLGFVRVDNTPEIYVPVK